MEENTLKERLIADIGAIRAENAKTRLWDSDERIADYLLAKGWTLPVGCKTESPKNSQEEPHRAHAERKVSKNEPACL